MWEYRSIFIEADTRDKQVKDFVEQTFNKKAKRYSPEALIPTLNEYGKDGWELIHMEPIPRVGGKENIQFAPHHWTNTYFCVFKRAMANESDTVEAFSAQVAPATETDSAPEPPPIELNPNMPY
ncbi:MAG: hypothetical protein AAF846_29615 [Chloroflexota bacterium]